MYNNRSKPAKTTLRVNDGYEGEWIEEKIMRIMNNKEPITDGAPLIYTERKDGVLGDYNIREDKWEHAVEATSKIQKNRIAKREKGINDRQAQKEGFTDHEAKLAHQNMKNEKNNQSTTDNK